MVQPFSSLPPGARGRIGVIQPAPGLMLEAEWARAMPAGVAFPVTRLALRGGMRSDYADMAARAPEAAAILASAQVDVIAYACGVGSLAEGPTAERALMKRLSEAAGGVRVIGMGEAAVEVIRQRNARRVTLVTPYPADINDLVRDYLSACGIEVAETQALPVASAVAAAGLSPAAIRQAACAAAQHSPTDLVWIACSNVRALDLIPEIERTAGLPCISSNQAMLEIALAHIGVSWSCATVADPDRT